MSRLFPLPRVHDLRRFHLEIARRVQPPAHISLQRAVDDEAVRVPEHRAVRLGLQMEQVHFRADFAVVALGGFFEPHHMRVELFLVEPAGAVNPRQLRILLVAAPIGTRYAHQLERRRVELASRGQMRPATHVHPRAGAVNGKLFVAGKFSGPFGLEALAVGLPFGNQVSAAPYFADQRLVSGDDAAHLGLDQRQFVIGKRPATGRRRKVIIKTIIGRRPKGNLRSRKQRLHRLGQDMRKVMPCEFERIGLIARCHQRKVGVTVKRAHDIAQFTVNPRGDGRLGQTGADGGSNIGRSGAGCDLAHRAIGKRDFEHLRHAKAYAERRPVGQA